jgi:hypothetical protein
MATNVNPAAAIGDADKKVLEASQALMQVRSLLHNAANLAIAGQKNAARQELRAARKLLKVTSVDVADLDRLDRLLDRYL